MTIVKEMISKLSECRTKADQFHTIAELACTHLYGKQYNKSNSMEC